MAFQSKSGQSFTNRPAAMRSDRMEAMRPEAKAAPPAKHKSVTIHSDGSKFHVQGDGSPSTEHDDIESALNHARSIFGGHEAASEDTAMEASGEGIV
jgi:hypothetical protein